MNWVGWLELFKFLGDTVGATSVLELNIKAMTTKICKIMLSWENKRF